MTPDHEFSIETLELKLIVDRSIRAVRDLRDQALELEKEYAEDLRKDCTRLSGKRAQSAPLPGPAPP